MIRQLIILLQDRLRAKVERRTMPREKAYRLTRNQMLRKLVSNIESDNLKANRYAAVQELKLINAKKVKVK